MQGLVDYQAILERVFLPTLQKVKGKDGGVNWDDVANMYNEMTRMEAASTLNLLSNLPITKDDSVLDVGCGPARLSVPLAKLAKSVSALDPFAKMLEYAKKNAKEAGAKNINFIQKDWSDEASIKGLPKHDIVLASRSVGLFDIKQKKDATLNFTASCRSAICGACAVRVNGHSYLACDTKMNELLAEYDNPDTIRISPLGNFKVISDLMVDWEPSIENLRKIKPNITAKPEFSAAKGCKQSQKEYDKVALEWDCILCGACASECNKLEADASDYMQPFVFVHAYRAAFDSRSKDPMPHLKPAIDNGLWMCVKCQECADRCPKGISACADITDLRIMAIQKGFNEGMGPDHAEAFLTDLVDGSGRLNEVRLALRSEGVIKNMGKLDIAANLMLAGKMNPLHVFGEEDIEGHDDLVKMINAARKAASKE